MNVKDKEVEETYMAENLQELLNAIYSGPFVTKAKAEYSNSTSRSPTTAFSTRVSTLVTRFRSSMYPVR